MDTSGETWGTDICPAENREPGSLWRKEYDYEEKSVYSGAYCDLHICCCLWNGRVFYL